MLKRFFDILLTFFLFPIIMPLTVLIYLIIKLTSPGPGIFTQQRVGMNGKLFKIYKFRTMYHDAEERLKNILNNDPKAYEEWIKRKKLKNDPRITKIGKFLRKTSLDELPQFINVIKGEMSIVGPRPYLPDEIKDFKEQAEFILSVPPGITGLWQVNGRSDKDFKERILLDCVYVKKRSLSLDFKIIIKTIKVVIRCKGAY